MAAIDDYIRSLRNAFADWSDAEATRDRNARDLPPADFDARRDRYDRSVKEARQTIRDHLQTRVLRYGVHYDRHGSALDKFLDDAPYTSSAFIMTKYPAPGDDSDKAKTLQKIMDLVSQALRDAKLEPRIAKDATYHASTWDNVELHALGCCLGVAIAESHYLPEFNPNVAMEWGWMRAMGRPVIFLVEKDFKLRGDVEGLIREQFDWNDPEGTIPGAIENAIATVKKAGLL